MSDTPRTDAAIFEPKENVPYVKAAFAAQLEREIDDARAEAEEKHNEWCGAMGALGEARAEAARLREALRGIADMPDYDQDNEHRLRHMAKRALEETK